MPLLHELQQAFVSLERELLAAESAARRIQTRTGLPGSVTGASSAVASMDRCRHQLRQLKRRAEDSCLDPVLVSFLLSTVHMLETDADLETITAADTYRRLKEQGQSILTERNLR